MTQMSAPVLRYHQLKGRDVVENETRRTATDTVPATAPLMTIDDVAAYLGVSRRWVYTQVRTGRLPAMLIARSWRLRLEAVDAFADTFRSSGGAESP